MGIREARRKSWQTFCSGISTAISFTSLFLKMAETIVYRFIRVWIRITNHYVNIFEHRGCINRVRPDLVVRAANLAFRHFWIVDCGSSAELKVLENGCL